MASAAVRLDSRADIEYYSDKRVKARCKAVIIKFLRGSRYYLTIDEENQHDARGKDEDDVGRKRLQRKRKHLVSTGEIKRKLENKCSDSKEEAVTKKHSRKKKE